MKALFKKPLATYLFGIFIVVFATGLVLYQIVDNIVILGSVLLTQFIILTLFLMHLYERYIRPIKKATRTIEEIVKGNYRARFHHPSNDSIGLLSAKINSLARNIGEFARHEKMQSEQLSTVIDNTQSGLILVDAKGYIHFVNRKFIHIFGGVPKDYKGHLYYDILENEIIHETVQKTFLYEKNVKEAFTHFKGIDKIYLEIVGAPIFNEKGMLKGAVLVIYDITEMKKLELMRKDFVANVSHELKTPITSIKGFAETLLDGTMDDKEASKEFLGIIYNESERLQLLIEDLLILSRLEKEDFQLVLSEINLKQVVAEVAMLMKHKMDKKKLSLSVNISDEAIIKADKERLKQVIINLLDNAINYTPVNGQIWINGENTNDKVMIEVRDTGIGIAQEALPRIFERFYRVDKARSRDTGGTGLGLAIVKHIVEVHRGDIQISSDLNKGTTVSVTFKKELID
ncbi:alkaline phosphatase synthesis sensor protein PhoR [Oceanobacillus picturae]|jgi:two-component system, OmpR family, phosphate regulon sensor histidine kinase PhoR|uniref:histidine kinase n=1 Tax=Oceanobacillus picturae TaxID=171693 RepID=W9AFI2_9BACI|nr:HAMP domain-containing sensor histidine kinase [Oceanobacillus picturae]RIU93757.1 PAS domain-containing sensor histidine kinase [Oceanobacillus picturae]GAQ18919.1 alkaline phosphatase synthesis sensor protein PhoR [Oceanobacillus picturae]CDO01657.1 Alkaline phosphatase synthesis sensor protein PhoR [Oceanobacillus picturae]